MGPGANDLTAITPGGTGAGSSGPAGAVPLSPAALRVRPAAAAAGGGPVRHAAGRAGGRPLMRFAALRTPADPRRPRRARIPALAAGVTAAVTAVCVAGCSSGGFNGIYSIPLPGGASLGSRIPTR